MDQWTQVVVFMSVWTGVGIFSSGVIALALLLNSRRK